MSCSIEREEAEGFGGAASRPASGIRSIADGFGEIYPQLRSMASTLPDGIPSRKVIRSCDMSFYTRFTRPVAPAVAQDGYRNTSVSGRANRLKLPCPFT